MLPLSFYLKYTILSLAVSLSGITKAQDSKLSEKWKQLNNSHYSFEYSEKWVIDFEDNSTEGFSIKLSLNKKDLPLIRLSVTSFPNSRDSIPFSFGELPANLEIYTRTIRNQDSPAIAVTIPADTVGTYWKRIELKEVKDSNQTYIQALHKRKTNTLISKRILRAYRKDNTLYYLSFIASKEDYATYESEVMRLFNSFAIK